MGIIEFYNVVFCLDFRDMDFFIQTFGEFRYGSQSLRSLLYCDRYEMDDVHWLFAVGTDYRAAVTKDGLHSDVGQHVLIKELFIMLVSADGTFVKFMIEVSELLVHVSLP